MSIPPLDLPAEVLELAEYDPIEMAVVHVLREAMPSVPVVTLIPEEQTSDYFVLVRRDYAFGDWRGDERFMDDGRIVIHTFTKDPDGDEKGAVLQEAIRVALRNAWLGNAYIPDHGWVVRIRITAEPTRKTDWATASGPVQYADLPAGYWRYESKYSLRVRRELKS